MARRGPTPLILPPKKEIRLNYGEMPSYVDFAHNFLAEQGFVGTYSIRAGASGEGGIPPYETRVFTAKQLYAFVKKLAGRVNRDFEKYEEDGSLASSILETLGIEWV